VDPRLAAHFELASISDEDFVTRAYRFVLRRPPDDEGRTRAMTRLADGTLSRATLLQELSSSDEFGRVRALDDGIALALHSGPLRGLTAPAGDERAVEIPWALSRLAGAERILDVGSANAEPAYLLALAHAPARERVALDLVSFELPGLHCVSGDVRAMPFDDGSFDAALCISTLEHVGADNRIYGEGGRRDPAGLDAGLRELRRVLAQGGRLVVTVPCGIAEDHGWFVQYPPDEWVALFAAAGLAVFEQETYALTDDGWSLSDDVDRVRYGERGPAAGALLCAQLTPGRAGAPPPVA
jgi:SAM-dependent methyltransferase